jgi:hypothetical protein
VHKRIVLVMIAVTPCLVSPGCSAPSTPVLITCTDTSLENRALSPAWILRLNEARQTAEMIVHVPAESVRRGEPENRLGRVHASERAYEVTIPADSGGEGADAWSRMQFSFEIDRFTGVGTAKLTDTLHIPIHCETAQGPNL